jgi:hypothetical protein
VAQTVNKRDFVRTDIGPAEKAIGGSILLLLLLIAAGIAYKGSAYDANLYTGDPDALESTRAAVEGKAATVRGAGDLRAYELAGAAGAPAASNANEISAMVAGLSPMGPTEVYNADTLYEKINGRAPAYLQFNFQELTSRSFLLEGVSGQFIDAYLFRMDSPINAYGIFSIERSEAGGVLDFIADGYRSGMGFFMRQGTTYIQVIASSSEALVMNKAEAFARGIAGAIAEDNSGLEGKLLLPLEAQVPGSLTYISEDAYGQNALSRIFEARYAVDGQELTLFAQSCESAEAASTNWDSLKEFYGKYGNMEEAPVIGSARVFVAESFGQWNILLAIESTLVGVVNASDRDVAIAFLKQHFGSSEAAEEEEYNY